MPATMPAYIRLKSQARQPRWALARQRLRAQTPAGPEPSRGDDSPAPDAAPAEESFGPKKTEKNVLSHALNETFAADDLVEELKDKEGFGKRGEAVLVAQAIVTFLVLFPPMRLQGLVYLCGILAMVAGVFSVVYSFACLGTSFSPLVAPRKHNRLIKTGMFQYVRHPIYAGCILLAFGLAAVTYHETRFVLALLLTNILNYKAAQEEVAMVAKHGTEYKEYMERVSRFMPTF